MTKPVPKLVMKVSHEEDYVNDVGYLVTSSDREFLVERIEEVDVEEVAREIYVDCVMISARAVVVSLYFRKDRVDLVDYADFPDCPQPEVPGREGQPWTGTSLG